MELTFQKVAAQITLSLSDEKGCNPKPNGGERCW